MFYEPKLYISFEWDLFTFVVLLYKRYFSNIHGELAACFAVTEILRQILVHQSQLETHVWTMTVKQPPLPQPCHSQVRIFLGNLTFWLNYNSRACSSLSNFKEINYLPLMGSMRLWLYIYLYYSPDHSLSKVKKCFT